MRCAAPAPSRAQRRCLSAATAAHKRAGATVLALVVASLASPAAAQSPVGPIDRAVVVMRPVFPAPTSGFLRLPETRSLPSSPARMPHDPAQGVIVPASPAAGGDRPVWQPARLEPVAGVDAQGRITSILEYTPGRFER